MQVAATATPLAWHKPWLAVEALPLLKCAYLDSHRDASPHASVHIAGAAATQQHAQLHLLKLALPQAGHVALVVHQVLPRPAVPDVTREGGNGHDRLAHGPGIAGAHPADPS